MPPRADAGECVAGADFAMFLDDVAGLAQSRLPLGRQPSLPRLARDMLRRQARRVRKRGRQARSREERDLHQLRIALKKAALYGGVLRLAPILGKRWTAI